MRKHARKFKYTTARPRPCLSATTCNFRREFPRRKHPIKVSSSRNEIVPFPLFRPRPRESIGNFTYIGGIVIPSNQIYQLFYIILKINFKNWNSSLSLLLSFPSLFSRQSNSLFEVGEEAWKASKDRLEDLRKVIIGPDYKAWIKERV